MSVAAFPLESPVEKIASFDRGWLHGVGVAVPVAVPGGENSLV